MKGFFCIFVKILNMKDITLILVIVLLLGSVGIFIYDHSLWFVSFIMSAIATIISFIQRQNGKTKI